MIIHQFDDAILALDQGRAGFHPIAAIVISDVAEFPDGCAMDMTAEHRVHRISFGVMNNSLLKFSDETDSVFHSLLRVGAKRPITEAEAASHKIDRRIERKQKLIPNVACESQPLD